MARHRNIRNYAYEEDMYEDVYGHSVEEHDLCVSPTTAQQFLYHRGEAGHPNLSSFMEESLEDEEDGYHENQEECEEYKTPKLDRESEAKLNSCLDQFRSILGDHCDDRQATAAILKHNFDIERAVDEVLTKASPSQASRPSETRREKDCLTLEISLETHPRSTVSSELNMLPDHNKSDHHLTSSGPGKVDTVRYRDTTRKHVQSMETADSALASPTHFSKDGGRKSAGNQTSLTTEDCKDVAGVTELGRLCKLNSKKDTPLLHVTKGPLDSLVDQRCLIADDPSVVPSLQIASLKELSKSNKPCDSSVLARISDKDRLGLLVSKDCVGTCDSSDSCQLVSLKKLSRPDEQSGACSLSQLSSIGSLDKQDVVTGNSMDPSQSVSLKELSQSNKKCGSLAELSDKGQLESLVGKECVLIPDPSQVISLKELSHPDDRNGTSLLSQLSIKGRVGFCGDERNIVTTSTGDFMDPSQSVSLKELSRSNEQNGASLLSQLSSKGPLGNLGDRQGVVSPGDPMGPSHAVSLKELSRSNEQSSASLLSQLSSKGPLGNLGDRRGVVSPGDPVGPSQAVSLKELSRSNEQSGASLPSQLSSKVPPGSLGDTRRFVTPGDPMDSSPLISLKELSQSNEQSGVSLLSQLSSKGRVGPLVDTKGVCDPIDPSPVLSLKELSQFNEQSGASLLSQLSSKGRVGSLGDNRGMTTSGHLDSSHAVSLKELSQSNEQSGASLLSLLSRKGNNTSNTALQSVSKSFAELASPAPLPNADPESSRNPFVELGGVSLASLSDKFGQKTTNDIDLSVSLIRNKLGTHKQNSADQLKSTDNPSGLEKPLSELRLRTTVPKSTNEDIDLSVFLTPNQSRTFKQSEKPIHQLKSTDHSTGVEKSIRELSLSTEDPTCIDHTKFFDKVDGGFRKTSQATSDGATMFSCDFDDSLSFGDISPLLGVPSMFACTLLVKYKPPDTIKLPVITGADYFGDVAKLAGLTPFDFNTPSPDDIVKGKQSKAFGKRF